MATSLQPYGSSTCRRGVRICVSLILAVALILLISRSASAQSSAPTPAAGVVRAVLFWRDSCPHCHIVIDQVLPPLQQQYGASLDMQLIETSSAENAQLLLEAATRFGIPPDQVGVPLLIIGDTALMGSVQIPAELPGLIAQHLARGGVDYPQIPGLAAALSVVAPTVTPVLRPEGFGLALVIMGAIIVALLAVGGVMLRWQHGTAPRRGQRGRRTAAHNQTRETIPQLHLVWLERALPALALAGLGVAGYLAFVETQHVTAICGPVGDCNAVQSSSYASLFGMVPIGVLGYAPLIVFGLALGGTIFSLYLTYVEAFVIEAICAWCLTSAIVITLLLLASVGPALRAYMQMHPHMA